MTYFPENKLQALADQVSLDLVTKLHFPVLCLQVPSAPGRRSMLMAVEFSSSCF